MAIALGTALAIGAIASSAGTVYAAKKAGDAADEQTAAANKATDAQTTAADKALAFERQVTAQRQGAMKGFIDQGNAAGANEAHLLGLSPKSDFTPLDPNAPLTTGGFASQVTAPHSKVPAMSHMAGVTQEQWDAATAAGQRAQGGQPAAAPTQAGAVNLVTVEAPDGTRKQVTREEAEQYQRIYGLKVVA